jgi:hypothetical protein
MGLYNETIKLVRPIPKQTYTNECAIFIGTILSMGAKSAAGLMHFLIRFRSLNFHTE